MKSSQFLRSLDDVLNELLSYAKPFNSSLDHLNNKNDNERSEIVSTINADHRVLAQDLVSPLNVPSFDNSAMDGYAIACEDVLSIGTQLPVLERIVAGSLTQKPLERQTAARIFTGAMIPVGANAVVMQEDCEVLEKDKDGFPAMVRFNKVPKKGAAIRHVGEDIAKNQVILSSGQRLNPASIGLAASVGFATLKVAKRPRVALFSTGNELMMPEDIAPDALPLGAIYNSNRFFLATLLKRMGCLVTDLGIVPDSLDATKTALLNAASLHDVIVTSGGVSVGEEDHVKAAVEHLGKLHLWQLAIKPGKPFAYGQIQNTHFVGLPGNPVSSWVTFLMLLRPFLLKFQGVCDEQIQPHKIMLPAHFERPKPDKRREFLRARRNERGGLDLFPNQSSGVLTSAVWSDGLVELQANQTIQHGELVSFIAFSDLF